MCAESCLPPLLLFCDCARLLRREINERSRDLALSEPQWRVIGVVHRIPGLRQRDLGMILGVDKGPLAELIERLVSSGWVLRQVDVEDRRSRRLELTPRGIRAAVQLRTRYRMLCDELAAETGAEGWTDLQQALALLARARAGPALNAALAPMAHHGQLHLLAVLCRQLRYPLRQWLLDNGLNHPHWLVLAALGHLGRTTQKTLGAELGLGKVMLAQTLAQMEEQGSLQRSIDPGDRRQRQVQLTDMGRGQWRAVKEKTDRRLEFWLQPLTAEQRDQLITGLQSIHGYLLNLAVRTAVKGG